MLLRTTLVLVLAAGSSFGQVTLTKPGNPQVSLNFSNISCALNNAGPGDTITVSPGTYCQNLVIPGIPLTLKSSQGPEVTTITGLFGSGSVLTVQPGATSSTVIEGFTIRDGLAAFGGGILCQSASPTIRNNIIRCNFAVGGGGGIACLSSSPLIKHNLILDNLAEGNDPNPNFVGGGGGIWCDPGSDAQILDNRILYNRAISLPASQVLGPAGGGIAVRAAAPLIARNEIRGNAVWIGTNGGGGGIAFYEDPASGPPAQVVSNLIYDNTGWLGGGIYVAEGATTAFSNNVVNRNIADDGFGGGDGGGMLVADASPTLDHDTLYDNRSHFGGGMRITGASLVTIRNSIVWGNVDLDTPQQFAQIQASAAQLVIDNCDLGANTPFSLLSIASNSFSADPLFADPTYSAPLPGSFQVPFTTRDFHVTAPSMAVDAGQVGATLMDFEGDPRSGSCDPLPDVGADERFTHLYLVGAVKGRRDMLVEELSTAQIRVVGQPGELALIGVSAAKLAQPLLQGCNTGFVLDMSHPSAFFAPIVAIPLNGFLDIPWLVPALAGSPYTKFSFQALVGSAALVKATNPVNVQIVAAGANALPDCAVLPDPCNPPGCP